MLADLKVARLSDAGLALLETTAASPPAAMPAEEHLYLLFALGKALEDAGRVADAFAALRRANDTVSLARRWDAAAASDTPAPAGAQPGREVMFLVGLPRSGTTLVEQIFSSHAQVEGASELPYLPRIVDAESRRCGMPFPDWVPSTTDVDWARMGQDCLRMSGRWRAASPSPPTNCPSTGSTPLWRCACCLGRTSSIAVAML